MNYPENLTVGYINGGATPIVVDISSVGNVSRSFFITLSTNYTLLTPPGYPTRPGYTGAPGSQPSLVPAGTRIQFIQPEAAALIAAGAGVAS
jgi:hypothetical protein